MKPCERCTMGRDRATCSEASQRNTCWGEATEAAIRDTYAGNLHVSPEDHFEARSLLRLIAGAVR